MNPAGKPVALRSSVADDLADDVTISDLRTLSELRACVELQREVWGSEFSDVVPASLMKIGSEVGGVAAGAFTGSGQLIGFVYGLTGVRNGQLTHWSHMLGVRRSHRGLGVGLRLKHFQRRELLANGVREMRWTFDPLVAGNAHFNLTLLGARVEEYVPDMYGDMGSSIHSFGTDRFVAHWALDEAREEGYSPALEDALWEQTPVLDPGLPLEAGLGMHNSSRPAAIRIEIPRNVLSLSHEDPRTARDWRLRTREAFRMAQENGYEVAGFSRDGEEATCHYLLQRPG